MTISSSEHTAAASGFSTTSRRCGSFRPRHSADGRPVQAAEALRFEWNRNTDTPLPPDEPAGQNPLTARSSITTSRTTAAGVDHARDPRRCRHAGASLRQRRSAGRAARRRRRCRRIGCGRRRFSPVTPDSIDSCGICTTRRRRDCRASYPIAATPHDTASEPKGPWVVPGNLHRAADGGRQELDAAADRDHGSAHQERHRGAAAAVRAVEAAVRRASCRFRKSSLA